MTSYELLCRLVETPSHDIRYYRMLNMSAVDGSTFLNVEPSCDRAPMHCKLAWLMSVNVRCITTVHYYTRLTALCPGLPRWAGTREVKPIWILLKQETASGNGIRWVVCKFAPRSRQITMPAPHYSVFYRPDALPAAQPTASKHWRQCITTVLIIKTVTVPNSQNVKDSSHGNKYLRKVKLNLVAEVEICISTYSNADICVTVPPAEQSWTNATPFAKLFYNS